MDAPLSSAVIGGSVVMPPLSLSLRSLGGGGGGAVELLWGGGPYTVSTPLPIPSDVVLIMPDAFARPTLRLVYKAPYPPVPQWARAKFDAMQALVPDPQHGGMPADIKALVLCFAHKDALPVLRVVHAWLRGGVRPPVIRCSMGPSAMPSGYADAHFFSAPPPANAQDSAARDNALQLANACSPFVIEGEGDGAEGGGGGGGGGASIAYVRRSYAAWTPLRVTGQLQLEGELAKLLRLQASGTLFSGTGKSDADVQAGASQEFVCPISKKLMLDPVNDAKGFTYSRGAITWWLNACLATGRALVSPLSNVPLPNAVLTPNHGLRGNVLAWVLNARKATGGGAAAGAGGR